MDVSIVYTITTKIQMIKELLRSLRSVRRFFSKREIIVFYTPKWSNRVERILMEYATVIRVPNVTKPFKAFPHKPPSYYGEKIHLCDVDSETVIFLDADTIVRRDLHKLLDGEYHFSARVPPSFWREIDLKTWIRIFRNYGSKPVPMPNTGFLIFRKRLHQKIKKFWLDFINSDIPNPFRKSYPKDQISLALALGKVSGIRIRWMSSREHAFLWLGELGWRSYVLHGRIARHNPIRKKINYWALKLLNHFRRT